MLKKDSDFKLISSHLDTGRLDAFVAVPKASDVTLSLSLSLQLSWAMPVRQKGPVRRVLRTHPEVRMRTGLPLDLHKKGLGSCYVLRQ